MKNIPIIFDEEQVLEICKLYKEWCRFSANWEPTDEEEYRDFDDWLVNKLTGGMLVIRKIEE